MKAGKNTPQSVLRYIDAVWERNAPPDAYALAVELGYGPHAYRRLKEKHGDGLVAHLEAVAARRQEETRFMASQHGQAHPQQYVPTVQGAIDDAEAPDPTEIEHYRESAQARLRFLREKNAEVEEVKAAMMHLKLTIDALPRETRRKMGRSFWVLRSRLRIAERDIKDRAA